MGIKNQKKKTIYKRNISSKTVRVKESVAYNKIRSRTSTNTLNKANSNRKSIKLSDEFIEFKKTNNLALQRNTENNKVEKQRKGFTNKYINNITSNQTNINGSNDTKKAIEYAVKSSKLDKVGLNEYGENSNVNNITNNQENNKTSCGNGYIKKELSDNLKIKVLYKKTDIFKHNKNRRYKKNYHFEGCYIVKKKIHEKILRQSFNTFIKTNIDSGSDTEDIGAKSISDIQGKIKTANLGRKQVHRRINRRIKKDFASQKIKTNTFSRMKLKKDFIKSKRKQAVIKNILNKKSVKSPILSRVVVGIKSKIAYLGKAVSLKALAIPLAILLLITVGISAGNSVSTSTSFTILTSDEQNQAYLDYYNQLKESLKLEIDNLVANSAHDEVIVYGLDPSGELYDLDFTEWISILTVKIEQDFKLNEKEYEYLKDVFNKIIYYETKVETQTSTDDDGHIETTTTLIITVNNKYYGDIKDTLGFDTEELEWVERLIENDSLKDRIEDIPSGSSHSVSAGILSPEEIEKYGGKMIHPLNGLGRLSSPYGYRIHPIFNTRKFHTGIDLAIGGGTPIYAAQDGVVTHSGNLGGYGQTIMISHSNGLITLYAHCSSLVVGKGPIKKGNHISNVGTTGYSTGNHLHFEVRVNGSTVNPLNFIKH